jgi:glycosyltransferase involved in cell wall biosynthesis
MNILFVHQNFPGQFKSLAPTLAKAGHKVMCFGDAHNIGKRTWPNHIDVRPYEQPQGANKTTHHYLQNVEAAVRRGQKVFRHAYEIKKTGFSPQLIVGHVGWGEMLYLKQLFPDAKMLGFFEFYYQMRGADIGFDPEFPATLDEMLRVPTRNGVNLLMLPQVDWCISPTYWQASTYPEEFHRKMSVVFDGVDTDKITPNSAASLKLPNGKEFKAGDEVLTFVNRNLEPFRGYHVFMRALPEILAKRPNAHVLIVGDWKVSYGRPPEGKTGWKDVLLDEVKDRLPMDRVHILGRVQYDDFIKILQISRAHVYFTYPFVQSWSMVEAMSAGCMVIGSKTKPVEEFLTDGQNGVLVDFFDKQALIDAAVDGLANPQNYIQMRENARKHIIANYDLRNICMPAQLKLLEDLLNKKTPKAIAGDPRAILSTVIKAAPVNVPPLPTGKGDQMDARKAGPDADPSSLDLPVSKAPIKPPDKHKPVASQLTEALQLKKAKGRRRSI